MKSFCVLLICVQICLIQNVFTQCIGPAGPYGLGYGPGLMGPLAPGVIGPGYPALEVPAALGGYGGSGVGDVAVAGEMPVAGSTLVAGQVPILGAVRFAGDIPAIGTVSIAGSCGCGCGNPGYYY